MIEIISLYNGSVLHRVEAETLRGADLSEANLHYVDLRGSDLRGANLRNADLRNAELYGSDLRGADLMGTNLRNANLVYTNLHGAKLACANLAGAKLAHSTVIDAGQDSRGYRFVAVQWDDGPRIAAGCRWFTLPEAWDHWRVRHDGSLQVEIHAKLVQIETVARAGEWMISKD